MQRFKLGACVKPRLISSSGAVVSRLKCASIKHVYVSSALFAKLEP